MAESRQQDPVLLVVAVFSRHSDALIWARARLSTEFGPIGLAGPEFSFHQTRYYEATMGTPLRKQLLAFEKLVAPDCLPEVKLRTNELEMEQARTATYPEPRPINLDPGILSLGKFQLATMKDQAHRIYLRDGVFAEVTLRFEAGAYEPWPWTYADYREPAVGEALREFREYYKKRMEKHT